MKTVKVLSIDGGAMKGLVSALLLQKLEEENGPFLDSVDVFAGTSSGGVLALSLASQETGRSAKLAQYIDLWQTFDLLPITSNARFDGLTGTGALFSNQDLKDGLSQILDKRMTLNELPGHAVIPTFQLDNRNTSNYGVRTARPYIYHTFNTHRELDARADVPPYDWFVHGRMDETRQNISILDVAMQGCAAPIVLPAYQGFIDGGLFAANPTMCALVLLLKAISNNEDPENLNANPGPLREDRLDNIQLLSIGTGRSPTYIAGGDKNWGAVQWLGDVSHPFALIDLLFGASCDIVDLQARGILGHDNYQRLDPVLSEPIWMTTLFTDRTIQSIKDTVDGLHLAPPPPPPQIAQATGPADPALQYSDHTLYWLRAKGWANT
jgi:uncharacterized protein